MVKLIKKQNLRQLKKVKKNKVNRLLSLNTFFCNHAFQTKFVGSFLAFKPNQYRKSQTNLNVNFCQDS
jgi:hypothetical protein